MDGGGSARQGRHADRHWKGTARQGAPNASRTFARARTYKYSRSGDSRSGRAAHPWALHRLLKAQRVALASKAVYEKDHGPRPTSARLARAAMRKAIVLRKPARWIVGGALVRAAAVHRLQQVEAPALFFGLGAAAAVTPPREEGVGLAQAQARRDDVRHIIRLRTE